MKFSFLKQRWSAPVANADVAVARDADHLIAEWGDAAYDRATYLSWEEDIGVVRSPREGHWWRVRREIARRLERPNAEPRAEFAPASASAAARPFA